MKKENNQKAQKFLVGNKTLQSKTKQKKLMRYRQITKADYTYKCSGETVQRTKLLLSSMGRRRWQEKLTC